VKRLLWILFILAVLGVTHAEKFPPGKGTNVIIVPEIVGQTTHP
jgi:hypothetical protein